MVRNLLKRLRTGPKRRSAGKGESDPAAERPKKVTEARKKISNEKPGLRKVGRNLAS
jgi:hypothetical protein